MSAPTAGSGIARVVGALRVIFAASGLLILAGPLTMVGNLAVAAVSAAVLLFTMLEVVGLTRLREMAG